MTNRRVESQENADLESLANGNVFRSLTLLAVTRCEQSGVAFGPSVLTPAFLAELVECLSFGKQPDGAFDISIKGYGLDLLVSQVANTTLKEPKVGKNIPTVAKMTQGEVVSFAAKAAELMRADGMNVLMEGRAQTLNYVRTPHRYELTLSDPIIIGYRRVRCRAQPRPHGARAPRRPGLGRRRTKTKRRTNSKKMTSSQTACISPSLSID